MFVDSGAWLAFLSATDRHHETADELVRRAASERIPLVTTNLVVAEVHRLLLHRAGIRAAIDALTTIADSAHVTLRFATSAHHQAARAWLRKLADQRITYTDATSFAVMEAERCRVALTFDRDFWIAGFELWQA